ncbi:hypothetical protein O9K51_06813 [Purpureocillium lavendulum]|uniref:Uncharacterized protein n=1 Tax=Purpureocillium lavendulum TaxID=1247861 RepID=A0AB34FQG3_9HYPO|nr:hypothetical protein O9K51_06813 [Purpureocillium lavendulum]
MKTSVETYVWDPECSFEELTRDGLIEKVKRDTGLDLDNRRTRGISIAMEGPGMKGPRQLFRLPHGRPEDFVTLRNEMKKVARQAVRRSRARGFAGDLEYELKIQAWTDELKREQLKECSY